MNKWIAEFELEDGDTMLEHMDLEYKGAKIDFHCKPLQQEPCDDCISRQSAIEAVRDLCEHYTPTKSVNHPHMDFVIEALLDLPSVTSQKSKYRKEAKRWKNKALKQKRVLDKIRAEIEEWQTDIHDNEHDAKNHDFVFERIFEIIDEYKSESEEV